MTTPCMRELSFYPFPPYHRLWQAAHKPAQCMNLRLESIENGAFAARRANSKSAVIDARSRWVQARCRLGNRIFYRLAGR
jgi:hypothetical protein